MPRPAQSAGLRTGPQRPRGDSVFDGSRQDPQSAPAQRASTLARRRHHLWIRAISRIRPLQLSARPGRETRNPAHSFRRQPAAFARRTQKPTQSHELGPPWSLFEPRGQSCAAKTVTMPCRIEMSESLSLRADQQVRRPFARGARGVLHGARTPAKAPIGVPIAQHASTASRSIPVLLCAGRARARLRGAKPVARTHGPF